MIYYIILKRNQTYRLVADNYDLKIFKMAAMAITLDIRTEPF